ncbi:uncharacterized protein JN550_000048 [Neoarthrinium moseri]|uniref:uncharacterized protein n=1 Tax=Neoarthrinium moseri TaxID=1658444 RepID=UPI001FDC2E24|nr:uncharacterized protein JN550_000048 [Neoarthrinium moseri]KAI1877866.1 hypothetical protein JN550_000048 [Neoarthrinium moseri]
MDRIPLEILHLVCSKLDLEDVYPFRLINRRCAEVGASRTFEEVVFYLHPDDFQQLRNIAQNYPHYVKSLICKNTILKDGVTFQEFERSFNVDSGGRKRRVAPSMSQERLREEYAKYISSWKDQDGWLKDGDDIGYLAEVISNFTQLKSIYPIASGRFAVLPGKSPFDQILSIFHTEAQPIGCRPMALLLSGLRNSEARLETIHARNTNPLFFDMYSELLQQPIAALCCLKCLELFLSEKTTPMELRPFKLFLTGLPLLEVLSVEFYSPVNLADAIPLGYTWKHLRSLALRGFLGEQEEFVEITDRHRSTLKELCLGHFVLKFTSFRGLLLHIRENLQLDYACICGIICGTQKNGESEGWLIGHPYDRAGPENRWVSISAYCCNKGSPGGEPCPDRPSLKWFDEYDDYDAEAILHYNPEFTAWALA